MVALIIDKEYLPHLYSYIISERTVAVADKNIAGIINLFN